MADIAANTTTTAELDGSSATGSFSGQIETIGDRDWIKVFLQAGTHYDFYFSILDTGSLTTGSVDFVLRDAAGNPVVFVSSTTPNLTYSRLIAETGIYYVDFASNSNNTGAYSIFVTSLDLDHKFLTAGDDINTTNATDERVFGGTGADFIVLENALDALGEQGNDIIWGNALGNHIAGGLGHDTIRGGGGFDLLFGDAGNDDLFGGDNRDVIRGGNGDDNLFGEAGADSLYGGLGKDFLTGDADNDFFHFVSVAQSKAGAGRDIITDFSQVDGDVITLIDIDARRGGNDNAFKFIGTERFHDRAGELRFKINAAQDRTILQGDVNGDGKADIEIELTGRHVLTPGDFMIAGQSQL